MIRPWLAATLGALLMVRVGAAQTGGPAADTPETGISPRAVLLLQQMSAYLGSATEFTVNAAVTMDHVLPSGQKLQYSARQQVALRRPNGLYVEWTGDLGHRQFWFDGRTVTLFDPSNTFYAAGAAPPTVDGMLGEIVERFGFSPPLADFLYRDPYAAVRGSIRFLLDLGPMQVDGRRCNAVAAIGRDVDWQLWIEAGPRPTPCKVVITYRSQPSQPQFTAVFSDWDFAPRIADSAFTADLPAGAEMVPFAPVVSRSR